jgi:hypothetical protein
VDFANLGAITVEFVRIRDVRVIDKDPSQCDTEVLRGGSIVDGLIPMRASELIPKPTEYRNKSTEVV